mmetsp:Transcript_369/g.558  ORF Transcript_369/g.558 Transcript_369/m.558 type:complete len:419 (-) Transcript_369:424-1680(-)
MNRKIETPEPDALPDEVQHRFVSGISTNVAFNPWGTLLACTTSNGLLGVWDVETMHYAGMLTDDDNPLPHSLTNLCWSNNGKWIVTTCSSHFVYVWSVEEMKLVKEINLDFIPNTALFVEPSSTHIILAGKSTVELLDIDNPSARVELFAEAVVSKRADMQMQVGITSDGEYAIIGDMKGKIHKMRLKDKKIVDELQLSKSPARSVCVSKKSGRVLVASNDRSIRLISADFLTIEATICDRVNHCQWMGAMFAPNEEYIFAASSTGDKGISVYTMEGRLKKTLESQARNAITCMTWHPFYPVIVCGTKTGELNVWKRAYTANWSAFAPNFQELTENVEYKEKEDEFDLVESEGNEKKKIEESGGDVDIFTIVKEAEMGTEHDCLHISAIPGSTQHYYEEQGREEEPPNKRQKRGVSKP